MKQIFKLKFSFTLISHSLKSIFYRYHSDKINIIKQLMPRPEVVIDVGAHAGQVSKMISRAFSKKVKIIAIEPGLYARFILRLSIFFNRLNNIDVLPFAVSDEQGFSFLNIPEKRKNSLGFGLSHMSNNHEDFTDRNFKTHYDYVSVTTIDKIVNDLELQSVDFIKIDIEGFEYKALLGANETLKKYKPIIYIELQRHSLARNDDSLDDLYKFLRDLGYKSFFVRDEKLVEYQENIEEDEVFFVCN
tara:strand:- start:999 stop:1736 length:738 start_codon:yes stop_codon:yes gene_type:complete